MSSGKKSKAKKNPDALSVERQCSETDADAVSRASLMPSMQATITLYQYNKVFGELSLDGLTDALREQIAATKNNDLARGEAMLTAQAHTLDAIFNNFARRSINAEYMKDMETYLKLALRAQSQCRATWEAISAIKNPPMVGYVGQANIANGPQQVNNGAAPPRVRKNENSQNELLERNDGERLDTGTAGTTGTIDPAMAPLGAVDRTEER